MLSFIKKTAPIWSFPIAIAIPAATTATLIAYAVEPSIVCVNALAVAYIITGLFVIPERGKKYAYVHNLLTFAWYAFNLGHLFLVPICTYYGYNVQAILSEDYLVAKMICAGLYLIAFAAMLTAIVAAIHLRPRRNVNT